MNGIAVSLYDKFDDLKILVDIIRHNWEDKYYITVCSNHPDASEKIAPIEDQLDYFEQGSQIRYDDSTQGPRGGNNLSFRIYDSIRTACRPAFSADDVDFVMHLHADAWPLSEQRFTEILQRMKTSDSAVAFPSATQSFVDKYPPGSFEDNFLIFDAEEANSVDLFEHSSLQLPPTWIHQILPMLCISKFGWDNVYQYTNGIERQHWDGTLSHQIRNDARPMFYHPEFDQLHVAREDFPDELGKSLQAYYLYRKEITKGKYIKNLLEEYRMSEDRLFEELESYIQDLNKELKKYQLSVDLFGRDIRLIKQFLYEKSVTEKIKTIIEMKSKNTFIHPFLKGMYKSASYLFENGIKKDGPRYNKYPNEYINDIYTQVMNKDDFPEELIADYEDSFGDSRIDFENNMGMWE